MQSKPILPTAQKSSAPARTWLWLGVMLALLMLATAVQDLFDWNRTESNLYTIIC